MKLSLAISALLILTFGLLDWRNQSRLSIMREERVKLEREAARLGLSANPAERASTRASQRNKADREISAKAMAAEFITFAKEMEPLQKAGQEPDEAMQRRIMDFMERVTLLDAGQLKILIGEFRGHPDLDEESRNGLIGFVVMTLGNNHPDTALELLVSNPEFLANDSVNEFLVSSSLSKWAKSDPKAAMEWVKRNGPKFPELIDDEAKRSLLSGTAATDPGLAFQFFKELEMSPSEAWSIVYEAKTPGQMTTTFAALRQYSASLPSPVESEQILTQAISNLSSRVATEGFEAGSKWISSTTPSPEELEKFAQGLSSHVKGGDTGRWIQWMDEKLPAEKSVEPIGKMVRLWAMNDYKAAADWLNTSPDGPAKHLAIRSYAETVAPYEPESAVQWALSLPAGKTRDSTLKTIHRQWPKSDPEGAAAFARDHGIK